MSSNEIPFTTRLPRNGGTKTWLSVSTSGDRAGMSAASTAAAASRADFRSGSDRPVSSRPNAGSLSRPGPRLSSMSRSIVRRPSNASRP